MDEKKNWMDEPVNPEYPEGYQEIVALLDFLPEEEREALLDGLVGTALLD